MFRRSPQPWPAHPVLIKQPMHINVTDALLQNGLCGTRERLFSGNLDSPAPHPLLKDTGNAAEDYGDFPAFCLIAVSVS